MQVRGAGARVDNAAHVDMAEAAPESLQMERQQIRDFPGRLDATQLEGCWFNLCGCCQGYRPTGPDSYVTSCTLMWGFMVCPDQGQVYTREPGTNNFRGPTDSAAYLIQKFKSKSIAFAEQVPPNGCEWMCCHWRQCKVPCSIPACITKGSMPPWLKKCCELYCSGDVPLTHHV